MKHLFTLFFFFVVINSYAQRNVILIIVDDLGTDYCGFYENHIDTCNMPNVRRLLSKGVRFKNAWSNPLCSEAGIYCLQFTDKNFNIVNKKIIIQ
jgi:hypothetical protein